MTARIPDATRAAIAAAYKAGANESCTTIARRFGISRSAVNSIALEHGIPLRAGRPAKPDDIAYTGGWERDGLILRPTITRKEAS